MEPEPTVSTVVAVVAVIVCEHFGVRCNAVCTQQEIAETSHDANLHDGLVRTVKHRTFWRLRRVSFHGSVVLSGVCLFVCYSAAGYVFACCFVWACDQGWCCRVAFATPGLV